MSGVFPIGHKEIKEYKGYAPPMFWGNWITIHEQRGGAREIEISFDTSASAASTFSIELDIDTSYTEKTLIGPTSYKFMTTDCICSSKVRFKSHAFGQFIDIMVKSF